MKKLVIQIPCYNEEHTLGITLSALPRMISGIDTVEWLIVDDGSTDRTVEVALDYGVDHVVRLPKHRGLARAFMAGLEACLKAGADIIVNTDADNQYCGDDIEALIEPIRTGRAQIVVGTRAIEYTAYFSPAKKLLQRLGSWVVRIASETNIPDAPSGFRAISQDAAMRINVFDHYTYTLEMIIQAGQKGIVITSVPVKTNAPLRSSRLIKSLPYYLWRSLVTIVRIFVVYKPFRFFAAIGATLITLGIFLGIRFLYFYLFIGTGSGHIQSLILASILSIMGFQAILSAFLADLLRVNRIMLEELQYKNRKTDYTRKEA